MARFAAFLRGMNLGNRRISNADLKAHVATLGFEQVALFRASGNVIVETDGRASAADVAARLEQGLEHALGYEVRTFARTAERMRAIAAFEPFDARLLAASNGKLQVTLLPAKPSAAAARKALALATDADRLALDGAELYWLPSGGLLESALDLKALDALLGVGTRRTKGTLDLIVAKYFVA